MIDQYCQYRVINYDFYFIVYFLYSNYKFSFSTALYKLQRPFERLNFSEKNNIVLNGVNSINFISVYKKKKK